MKQHVYLPFYSNWLALVINLAYIALHYVFIWFLLGWLPKRHGQT